jgi:uncharacterized protein (DUF2267 family)
MEYDAFISTVKQEAAIDDEEAARAACATLTTLAERISVGEADDLGERLPRELRSCLAPANDHGTFHVDEFLRRIAERVGVDEPQAERDARAVFAALWVAAGPDEFADMRSELPKDFDPLLDAALREAPPPEVPEPPSQPALSFDEFLEHVSARAGLDRERALRAIEAVLEVLAIRITGGQVDDLELRLPAELRPPLERGRAISNGAARPMSLQAFLSEIANREGVDRGLAAEHARAVLRTLREAIGEKEWHDTVAQLPDEYRTLWRQG